MTMLIKMSPLKEKRMQVSLPMYGVSQEDVLPFWQALRGWLVKLGVKQVPHSLVWPEDLLDHWCDTNLLLSQTCGYPLVELLPDVNVVGVFSYQVAECEGPYYRSILIARKDDAGKKLADFRHRKVAFNSEHSQSGYNTLRGLVAPLAEEGKFFAESVASGSHYQSIELVKQGAADIAAIDCISLELLRRANPESLKGIKKVGETALAPGLPLITSAQTSPAQLALLRQALRLTIEDPACAEAREKLLIKDFSVLPRSAYGAISELKQQAAELGVTAL